MAPRIADHQLRQGLFILNAWRSSLRNSSDLATSSLQQLQQQLHLNLQSPLHDVVIGYLFDDCTTKASKQCSPSSKTTERVLRRPIWVRTLMTIRNMRNWWLSETMKKNNAAINSVPLHGVGNQRYSSELPQLHFGERNQFWVQDFDGTCCREKGIWWLKQFSLCHAK